MHSIALDINGTVDSYPEFFRFLTGLMQKAGCQVGILTAEPQSNYQEVLQQLEAAGIKPDFCILKPDSSEQTNGEYKADACNSLGIEYLFDDFESCDPKMMADFFSKNQNTTVFTGFPYSPELT